VALKFQAKITKERKSAISAPSSEYEKFKWTWWECAKIDLDGDFWDLLIHNI
jgi:hypothetical protein